MQLVQLHSLNYICVNQTFAMKNVCWYQDSNQQISSLENITLLPCPLSYEWIWIFQCSIVFVSALQSNVIISQKVMNFKVHIKNRQLSDVGNSIDWKADKSHTLDKWRKIIKNYKWLELMAAVCLYYLGTWLWLPRVYITMQGWQTFLGLNGLWWRTLLIV